MYMYIYICTCLYWITIGIQPLNQHLMDGKYLNYMILLIWEILSCT